MIKVSVMYPNSEGCKFDMSYYLDKNMPMVREDLGDVCKYAARYFTSIKAFILFV